MRTLFLAKHADLIQSNSALQAWRMFCRWADMIELRFVDVL